MAEGSTHQEGGKGQQVKRHQKPRQSVLGTMKSVVQHLLTPSWFTEGPSGAADDQGPELINGERGSSIFLCSESSPRSTRDCAVGPDDELIEASSPSMPVTSRPETLVQRPLQHPQERLQEWPQERLQERPQERPQERLQERLQERSQEQPLERTLERLFERPLERYERPSERLSERLLERPLGQTLKRTLERSPEQSSEWLSQQSQQRPGASPSSSSRTSLIGTPSIKRQKLWYEDSPMKSPFYSGQTTYGGAAAQNRLRMLATSQSPTVPVMARSVKPGGATVGLSNTTRQILATLEKMATPVTEAKRVPLRNRMAGGRTWTLPNHRDPPAPTQGGPPIRGAARPSVRTVVPHRTDASRLEVSRKESIAVESSWADSLKAKVPRAETGRPEVPLVEAPKQYPPRRTEAPSIEASSITAAPATKPNSVASAWVPPSNRPLTDRAPGGGKMVRVIHTAHPAPVKMSGPTPEPEEELPPPVPLPPIQSLPTFSFNLKPPQLSTSLTLVSNTSTSGRMSSGSVSSGPISSAPASSSNVSTSISACPVSSAPATSSYVSTSISTGPISSAPASSSYVSTSISAGPLSTDRMSTSSISTSFSSSGPGPTISSGPISSGPISTGSLGATSMSEFAFSKPKPLASCSAALVAQPQRDQVYRFSEPWGPHGDKEQQEKLPNETADRLKKPGDAIQVDPPAKSTLDVIKAESKQSGDTKEPENSKAKNDKDCSSTKGANGGDLWERFKPAAGSWSCSVCLISNPPSASCCQACETPCAKAASKVAAAVAPTSLPSSVPAPVAPLPTSVATAASSRWECSTCLVRNETSAARCCACEAPRPSASSAAPSATPSAVPSTVAAGSLWECDTCLVRNQPTATRCCACENPRPSASSASLSSTQAAATFNFKLPSSESSGFGGAPFAAAPTQFKFGIPSSGAAKLSEEAPASESAAKPFKFGIGTSTTTVTASATKPTTSAAAAPLKNFKFGSSSEDSSKAVNIGSMASEASKTFKFGSSTEAPATTTFKFGTTTNEPATRSFKFGIMASEQNTKAITYSSEEPTKRDKPSTTTEEAAKLFNFGSSSEQPTKPLKFGCTTDEPAKLPQAGSGAEVSAKTFKFGSTTDEPAKPSQTSSSAEGAPSAFKLGHMAEPSKGFTFGSTVKEPAKPFTFGSTPSSETPTGGGFKFGSAAEEPAKTVKLGSSEEQQPAANTFKFMAPAASAEPSKVFQFGATAEQPPKLGTTVDMPAKPFSFGTPATAAEAAPKPFSFGLAGKPNEMPASTVTTQQPSILPQGGSLTTTAGQLPGFLAPATTAPAAISLPPPAAPAVEPAKPAFSTSQFVFGQKTDASTPAFSFGSQPAPAFSQPASSTSAPLPSFGNLTNKPPEPQVAAQQPTFGIGAATTPAFGSLNPLKPAATSAVAPTGASMPSGFGCQQQTPSTGFGMPTAAVPTQPSFIFRPPATTPPVTFQFGSTGPTSGGVFRFGAQPSQPATPLQQQPQQQQPALEPFGTPFGQTAPMQFGMSPSPLFPGVDSENPFNATSGSSGAMQQRRIRKAIRRKPTPR